MGLEVRHLVLQCWCSSGGGIGDLGIARSGQRGLRCGHLGGLFRKTEEPPQILADILHEIHCQASFLKMFCEIFLLSVNRSIVHFYLIDLVGLYIAYNLHGVKIIER